MFKDLFVQLLQENNVTAYKLSRETGITEGLISQLINFISDRAERTARSIIAKLLHIILLHRIIFLLNML